MSCKKITDILAEKPFSLSVEFVPPRNGEDISQMFKKIEQVKECVDFVSVTKGAGGSLRGGSLTIAYFSQQQYNVTAVAHFVCRERTRQEIENDLTDLKYFGIKNILALRGDPPAGSSEEWSGDYKYAYLLVEQIAKMNRGVYLPTPAMKDVERKGEKTDFCIAVAGHPEDDMADEIKHLRAKIESGAELIITQMLFSFEAYRSYVEAIRKQDVHLPVVAGLRPLVSYDQAESVEKFFKVPVSAELKSGLAACKNDAAKARAFGVEYAADMIRQLKGYGCPGVHLFVLNDVDLVLEILQKI